MRPTRRALLALPALALPRRGRAAPLVRVGLLRFGSGQWVVETARRHGLDLAAGLRVEPVELAGTPAAQVALRGGRVDVILADWLWVARQRAMGEALTFAPFSTALGAVMAPEAAGIGSVAALRGRRLGVAGSPLDKSWLLLRLLALRESGIDLETETRPAYGAPPLLSEQLIAGRLDAVLTYWPAAARLEARGFCAALPMQAVLAGLGFPEPLPMVGWTYAEAWAAAEPAALAGLARAAGQAMARLDADDEEWQRLAPLTGAADTAELARLRAHFRAGIPRRWGAAEREAAARLHGLLAEIGGERLVGPALRLPPGTFAPDWPGVTG